MGKWIGLGDKMDFNKRMYYVFEVERKIEIVFEFEICALYTSRAILFSDCEVVEQRLRKF